ncbi:hypothetical protein ACVBEF_19020 [Glaciimonas sp. GG7]
MSTIFQIKPIMWAIRWLAILALLTIGSVLSCAGLAVAAGLDRDAWQAPADRTELPDNDSARLLRAKYAELHEQLSHNQFKQPLYLDSVESSSHLTGDIYALVDYSFATVNTALNDPTHWCDVLTLHLNIKYCHATIERAVTSIMVNVGTKYDKPLAEAYPIRFTYRLTANTSDYFAVRLDAQTGPLQTRDYHIVLKAVAVADGKAFLHLTYSYAFSFAGRLAMQGYLATIGRDKVGFTVKDAVHTSDQLSNQPSQPDYIGGVRGLIERNTMRYYLAIASYLATCSAPSAAQHEMRLQNWFTSTEQYHLQLHEMDRATYLDMKRSEYLRQQKTP